jgi:metal-responsive CopG/Arc/MetJ family transcriptional regulator
MKTAISIPDNVYKLAEKTAKKFGVSRSGLYVIALEEYLARHDHSRIAEALDAVYGEIDSSLDPKFHAAQIRSIDKDEW